MWTNAFNHYTNAASTRVVDIHLNRLQDFIVTKQQTYCTAVQTKLPTAGYWYLPSQTSTFSAILDIYHSDKNNRADSAGRNGCQLELFLVASPKTSRARTENQCHFRSMSNVAYFVWSRHPSRSFVWPSRNKCEGIYHDRLVRPVVKRRFRPVEWRETGCKQKNYVFRLSHVTYFVFLSKYITRP